MDASARDGEREAVCEAQNHAANEPHSCDDDNSQETL